ncbi:MULTISPECIES: ABC transporter substrate-binding protein [Pseudofrankia]|uniref:ABC transporter substrate-binding protein n=1 Tax=Pseudofrankia TaxID=2994363 RepID=UPI000234CEA7|nr:MULTISPECIES: ABC transporter substrate-binding protein [Pseudofrankia]OHV37461.1 arginine ABC transporter substrate-binding protein [Pseudofrankia sp. EUN1h]
MRLRTHRIMGGGLGHRAARRAVAATAAAGLLAVLAACGGGDDSSDGGGTTAAPSANPSVVATLPAKYAGGTLKVAADASYAPNEFFDTDGKTVIGMDVDLIQALGAALGVKVEVENAGFDDIIPGLAAGKYDIGISSFTDTKEREEVVDFVTYYSAGTSFFTSAAKPATLTGLDDLCGLTVAVETGTVQADDAAAQDTKCKGAGKPGVTVQAYPDQNQANLALTAGRAQVSMADSPVADYQVKLSEGKLKSVGTPYGTAPYGIAVPKNSGLAEPLLAALKAVMADGSYQKTLEKWGVQEGAITDPKINGAVS